MKEFGEFWSFVFFGLMSLIITYWYIPVGYITLYLVAAWSFLLTLRAKAENGQLIVERTSLHYRIAHPVKFHENKYRSYAPVTVNICTYFARVFNMLFFVWPFLILGYVIVTIISSIIGLLFFSSLTQVGLDVQKQHSEFPLKVYPIKIGRRELFPCAFLLLGLLILAIIKFSTFLAIGSAVITGVLVASPVIILVVLIVGITRLVRKKDPESVNLAFEKLKSTKSKFCKLVEIK